MKKILLSFTMLMIVVGLSSCTGLSAFVQAFEFASDEEVFSFSAISTSALLSDKVVEPLSATHAISRLSNETPNMTIEQIEPFLEMFESLLMQNNGLSVVTGESDLELYETKSEFTVVDLLGTPVVYTMYYNTILLNEEIDEQELQYEINGILLVGTTEYQITGSKKIEDGEEKMTFKSYFDENNYVISKYQIEDDEKKFSIQVVENGITVLSSKIKVEIEDNETTIKLEYTEGVNQSIYSFKVEVEGDISVLKIKYQTVFDGVEDSGKITVQVAIDELTGVANYQIYIEPDHEEAYEHESERKSNDDDDDQDDYEDQDDQDDQDNQDDYDDQDDNDTEDIVTGATV